MARHSAIGAAWGQGDGDGVKSLRRLVFKGKVTKTGDWGTGWQMAFVDRNTESPSTNSAEVTKRHKKTEGFKQSVSTKRRGDQMPNCGQRPPIWARGEGGEMNQERFYRRGGFGKGGWHWTGQTRPNLGK